jgi:hypothetical protein
MHTLWFEWIVSDAYTEIWVNELYSYSWDLSEWVVYIHRDLNE